MKESHFALGRNIRVRLQNPVLIQLRHEFGPAFHFSFFFLPHIFYFLHSILIVYFHCIFPLPLTPLYPLSPPPNPPSCKHYTVVPVPESFSSAAPSQHLPAPPRSCHPAPSDTQTELGSKIETDSISLLR